MTAIKLKNPTIGVLTAVGARSREKKEVSAIPVRRRRKLL
jgi:hypothetical protein